MLLALVVASCGGGSDGPPPGGANADGEIPAPTADGAASKQELMQADRDFFAAVDAGGLDAWLDHFTNDAVRLELGSTLVQGRDAIRVFDEAGFADSLLVLVWEPIDATVLDAGRHGVTTGRYAVVNRGARSGVAGENPADTLSRGSYVTLWRRENGGWRVALDTGAPDPPAE